MVDKFGMEIKIGSRVVVMKSTSGTGPRNRRRGGKKELRVGTVVEIREINRGYSPTLLIGQTLIPCVGSSRVAIHLDTDEPKPLDYSYRQWASKHAWVGDPGSPTFMVIG